MFSTFVPLNGFTTALVAIEMTKTIDSMKIFVETERLILRELVPEDEDGLFELDSDPAVHEFLGNKPITNREQAREAIQFIRQQYIDNGIGRWAIVEKKSNAFIGWTGLKLVKKRTNNHINYYDVGYRLIKRYWGQGFATESAEASLQYGFNTLNIPVIYAIADSANAGSQKVLEKAGLHFVESFDYEGAPHKWYKILKSEWAERKRLPGG